MNVSLSEKRIEYTIQLMNRIFPLIILPLATIGNFLCFLVFCQPKFQKRLTRASSICLRLLCMNDLILLYLFIIDVLLKIYMKPSMRIYSSPTTCRLYKFIRYSFLDMSAYLQLSLTTDRFICCVHHTYYSHWRKKNYLYYLLIIAFLLIIFKNSSFLSPLYGYSVPSKNRTVIKCSVIIQAKYFAMYMAYGQSLIDVVFITCIPFFLILYFNSRILREVLRLRTECWNTLTKLIHLTPGQTVVSTNHRAKHRRLHLTFALGCISFVFVLSAAPYKIFKIVERHDKLIRDQQKHGISKTIHIQLAEVIIECLEYLSCSTPFFVCLATSIESNCQSQIPPNNLSCIRDLTPDHIIKFTCPDGSTMDKLDIDNLQDDILNTIVKLQVTGMNGVRGPLTSIPTNICRLKQLKHLDLSSNQIRNAIFDFTSPCLSQIEILDLSNNYLIEIPIQWFSQMFNLKILNLSENKLYCIPYKMFYNISNIEQFDVSSNKLITFELWLIQIKFLINYSNNQITHFTNNDNVDLSNKQFNITEKILFKNNDGKKLVFDDSIFIMYNRCKEIYSIDKTLMKTIKKIHENNTGLLHWNCSCEQYYLQEYIVSSNPTNNFSNWPCSGDNTTYRQRCNQQSSINGMNIKPRLCKINDSEPGHVPELIQLDLCDLNLPNSTDLEIISSEIYNKLITINLLDETMSYRFATIIDRSNNKLNQISSQIITKSIQNNFQNITSYIEHLISLINIPINITMNSVSILSLYKNSSIYSYSQINQTNLSSLSYSIDINNEYLTTSITIDSISIQNLNETDIYTFYYLPSTIFQYAQEDQNKIIVSPIVGIYLPNKYPHLINMTFKNIKRQAGKYSCEFWQLNRWNDTGCFHYEDLELNHHFCSCNHTTSFALIFIPAKMIPDNFIPFIIIAIVSILCFCISIILSICRQATSFRHLSIANIFTLLNSLILFILLTIILIHGYQISIIKSKIKTDKCSISSENLTIATYFFLLTTFASKTFLGICYFLTIFFHFIFIQFTFISNKWFYIGIILVILIAIIPIIIIKSILNQWINLFVQYENICWFNSSVIFRFISIPIIIFISLNLLIIFGIMIRLFQFCIGRKTIQSIEKRMIISIMIWISLCISLGIGWIFGPFLDMITKEKNQTSSIVMQWIFGFFIGLEGVWVLIINVIFYLNQRMNIQNHKMILPKVNKYQF